MTNKSIVEKFELTTQPDKKGFDDLYLKRLTLGKEKDLGKASMGKFYNSIWNLGEKISEGIKDPERYISITQRIDNYTCWLKFDGKSYQVFIPKTTPPVEIVFTEKDEHVKDFRGKWVKV